MKFKTSEISRGPEIKAGQTRYCVVNDYFNPRTWTEETKKFLVRMVREQNGTGDSWFCELISGDCPFISVYDEISKKNVIGFMSYRFIQ